MNLEIQSNRNVNIQIWLQFEKFFALLWRYNNYMKVSDAGVSVEV